MMVVMAVMAEALHLKKPYGKTPRDVKSFVVEECMKAQNGGMRMGARWTAVVGMMLGVCLVGAAQNQDTDRSRAARTSANAPAPEARIDINHATVDELMKAPGLTRTWAERIVRFRPYRTKQDLVENGVVTGEVYERIKDFVIAHREKQ
jgi:DNA uptake protein ComE-like DNA-binding protein